jgi:hypothetical protein
MRENGFRRSRALPARADNTACIGLRTAIQCAIAPAAHVVSVFGMRTLLVILGIWLLINVLFVVIMTPPRKPRGAGQPRSPAGLAPATIEGSADRSGEDGPSLHHAIITAALGAMFALTPPLPRAFDDIKRLIGKFRQPAREPGPAGEPQTERLPPDQRDKP